MAQKYLTMATTANRKETSRNFLLQPPLPCLHEKNIERVAGRSTDFFKVKVLISGH